MIYILLPVKHKLITGFNYHEFFFRPHSMVSLMFNFANVICDPNKGLQVVYATKFDRDNHALKYQMIINTTE